MKITAAVVRAPEADFSIETLEIDAPRDEEVLVRIAGVGLCHTDLLARDQSLPVPLPAVFGHEGAGVVEQVGAKVTKVRPGDCVVLSFLSCGQCACCDSGEPSYCHHFTPLNFGGARGDGSTTMCRGDESIVGRFFGQSSFASYALATERNVVKVDGSGVPLSLLGPLGCGFQTGAGAILHALDCKAGESLAIFGSGAVGMSAVMAAAARLCDPIIVVEPLAARRELALELGATHVIDPAAEDVVAAIRNVLPVGVDHAFDTSGIPTVMENALASLAVRGTLGVVAAQTPETSLAVNLTQAVLMGLTVKGILEGDSAPDRLIPELIDMYRNGRFPLEKLIQTFPLAQINNAVAAQHRGECVKAVLIP